jgi:hypothetical protein
VAARGREDLFAAIAPSVAKRTPSSRHGGALSASWSCRRFLTLFAWPLLVAVAAVSEADAAQLTASWIDNSSAQAAFELDRRTADNPTFSKIADLPTGSQSYVDPDVTEGVTYCYRVRAYTDAGASPYSDEACSLAPASLEPAPLLSITKAGSGNGGIMWVANAGSSSGVKGEVLCGLDCTATFFPPGGVITLTAVPAQGSRFVGWSGGCSGTDACTLVGNTSMAVTATFSRM